MSYHIYTTKGLILKSTPLREADRIYTILTRDLGLIRASASGVRKEESKLRGALEPLAFSQVSLVRGKEYWRITSAELIQVVSGTPEHSRPLNLLQALIQGEEAHPELFDAIEEFFSGSRPFDETLLVAHILRHLGYLKESDLALEEKSLVAAINDGLRQSHLV